MRITIDESIFEKILKQFTSDVEVYTELVEARKRYDDSNTENKKNAMNKARKTKEVDAQKKVMNAVNLATLQGLNITPGVIAKLADVHYYTARKYLKLS